MTSTIAPEHPTRSGSDFAQLARRIKGAGLLERRPRYYSARFAIVAVLYLGAVATFFMLGSSWLQLIVAGFLAVMFGQLALLAHDIAHRQVFPTRKSTELAGRIVGNLGMGMSYGWWMDKHTRHHANPNHEELDPDVNPDIFVWSREQATASKGLARFVGRRQAFLFFPLLTLEGLNLRYASLRALLRPDTKRRGLEAGLMLAHIVGYVTALVLVLSPAQAIAFAAVHQGLFGLYLGSIFAPNHKGMPILRAGEKPDFLRKQVLTARNVRGGRFIDIALGGLNYQIEHHLFPSMPSPMLRQARPIVRGFCAEIGIDYCETGLVRSWREALRSLHASGEPIRSVT